MTRKLPLHTLTELASERTQQSARRLAELLQAQAGATQRLDMLLDYREEYLGQMHDRMCEGLPAAQLRNFHQFVATLDAAVEQQRRLARQAETRLAEGRTDWQANKRRLGAFGTLAERARRVETLDQVRREQRDGDERASIRLQLRPSAFAA